MIPLAWTTNRGEVSLALSRDFLIAFNMIHGIGPWRIGSLVRTFGSLEKAWSASYKELLETPGIGPNVAQKIVSQRTKVDPVKEEEWAGSLGGQIVTLVDSGYPVALRKMRLAPPVLYIVGSLPSQPGIAVVGTRRASRQGLSQARLFAREFVRQGCAIVSGLAKGIDHEAHTAALSMGGKTVAVLGSNIGTVYPREHLGLARKIATDGALVSEFASTHRTVPGNFPRRNRMIAGLSQRILVVEAGIRSGAINTADWAAELGMDVWAIPGNITDPLRGGTNRLIQQGAGLALDPSDVLLGLIPETNGAHKETTDPIAELYFKGASPDEISARLSVPVTTVLTKITELELSQSARPQGPPLA